MAFFFKKRKKHNVRDLPKKKKLFFELDHVHTVEFKKSGKKLNLAPFWR